MVDLENCLEVDLEL